MVSLIEILADHPNFQIFQRLEWLSYDWRVREAARYTQTTASNLAFVFIDDDSLAELNEGKLLDESYGLLWPRHIYGRLVRELSAQKARIVGFDVLFDDLRPDHLPIELPDKTLLGSDQFFAEQLKKAGNVALATEKDVIPAPLFRTNAFAIGDISNETDQDGVLRRVQAFTICYEWSPLFRNLARRHHKKVVLETNRVQFFHAVTRQLELTIPIDDQGYFELDAITGKKTGGISRLEKAYTPLRAWHMGIVLAARELSLDLEHPVLEPGRIILRGPGGTERILPVDNKGRFLVNWSLGPNDRRLIRANIEHVLVQDQQRQQGETAALTNRFQNALVMVGSAAVGSNLSDMGATPLSNKTLLVSSHWNVANTLIKNQFIRMASNGPALALILLLGIASSLLNWQLRAVWSSLWVGVLTAAYVAIGFFLYIKYQYCLPLVLPAGGALLGTHISLVTYRAIFEQHERRRIKNVFAKIVSPNVVNELLKAEKLPLDGTRRKLTIFFADVRGFTEMTDISHAQAEEYVRQHKLGDKEAEAYFDERSHEVLGTVNLYLGLIADTIKKHQGTLDKYIGDCVMAFWGSPTPNEKHALDCVRAAIEAQRAIFALNQNRVAENKRREQMNRQRAERGEPPLEMLMVLSLGSGINTGVVTVGLMGSEAHVRNYTVFGRDVNLASRLEGVSGHDRIIIGEATYLELLQDDPELASSCIERTPEPVKGFRTPVKNFEVPWKTDESMMHEPAPPKTEVVT